jgi:small-conductance mechanosensitive channel
MVSFLLFISFPFFVNSVSANSKVNFYTRSGEENVSEKHVERVMAFAEVSFGFGFTLVISALSILGYEYLKDFTSQHLISILLPIIFLAVVWFVCIAYTYVDHLKLNENANGEDSRKESGENEIKKEAKLKMIKRMFYISVEVVFLIFIILDYFGIFLIQ